ncbi:hypothetical protein WJX74_009571 [Apatococcus lobatus]|uniref:Nucleolar protein 12 n=1 Tax=Apatococcus lobatus TaxID=904363 RepID=A0AAW1QJT7_9CHLO
MGKRSRGPAIAADALVFDEEARRDGTRPAGALAKRKQRQKGVEIQFDPQAHKEYLTGFSKRKQQRRKQAASQQAKKAKEQIKEEKAQRKAELRQELDLERYETDPEDEAQQDCVSKLDHDADQQTFVASDWTATVTTMPVKMNSSSDEEAADSDEQPHGAAEAKLHVISKGPDHTSHGSKSLRPAKSHRTASSNSRQPRGKGKRRKSSFQHSGRPIASKPKELVSVSSAGLDWQLTGANLQLFFSDVDRGCEYFLTGVPEPSQNVFFGCLALQLPTEAVQTPVQTMEGQATLTRFEADQEEPSSPLSVAKRIRNLNLRAALEAEAAETRKQQKGGSPASKHMTPNPSTARLSCSSLTLQDFLCTGQDQPEERSHPSLFAGEVAADSSQMLITVPLMIAALDESSCTSPHIPLPQRNKVCVEGACAKPDGEAGLEMEGDATSILLSTEGL